MTITYGFYDSVSSDRLYNAKQMGSIFDGLILDGVYPNYGDAFEVLEDTGMDLTVGIGRAWFNHTWTYNDALHGVTIPTADALLDRIDIVYLEVDESVGVRANKIDVLEGTPASTPVPPTLTDTATVHQYALAHIYVGAGVTSIVQANITDMIGTAGTPFVELVTISEDMQAQIYAIVGDVNPPLIDLIEVKGHNHTADTPQIPAAGLAANAVETAKIKNYNVVADKLAPDAVIAGKIANGAVDQSAILANNIVDDTKVGNRVAQVYRRQGVSATNWDGNGATTFTPGPVRIQCGSTYWSGTPATTGYWTVTLPVAFAYNPLVFLQHGGSVNLCILEAFNIYNDEFGIRWTSQVGSISSVGRVYWMAIGPE